MWNEVEIEKYLKKNLKPDRYAHSLRVSDAAIRLAKQYKVDEYKACIAGLAHDCGKNLSDKEIIRTLKEENVKISEIGINNPQIMHGYVSAIIAKNNFDIEDQDILNAVAYHTTGRKGMSLLEKIIYLADYIEFGRDFPGVDGLREQASKNLDKALIMAFNSTINYVLKRGMLLHIDTVKARNELIIKNDFQEES